MQVYGILQLLQQMAQVVICSIRRRLSATAESRSLDNWVTSARSASRSLGRGSIDMTLPNRIRAPLGSGRRERAVHPQTVATGREWPRSTLPRILFHGAPRRRQGQEGTMLARTTAAECQGSTCRRALSVVLYGTPEALVWMMVASFHLQYRREI
jgi:hypothetical protein